MASANALILTKRLADAYFTGSYKMLLVITRGVGTGCWNLRRYGQRYG